MFLDDLKQILGVVSPLAVAVGVVIALLQLRNQHRLRQIDTVMRLYSSFGQDPFVRHFRRVTSWDFPTYEAYLEKGTEEDFVSLTVVTVFFEGMGLLLKRRLAPIDLLDDLLSGPILLAWPKARPIWLGFRIHYGVPAAGEWFEFLHDAIVHRTGGLREEMPSRAGGDA
ncbi:MAG TPA: hypothetical protein VLD63_06815 [Anaerolineales bacterium]|nr:hypothetical protein [Anaerolineales bacterium]